MLKRSAHRLLANLKMKGTVVSYQEMEHLFYHVYVDVGDATVFSLHLFRTSVSYKVCTIKLNPNINDRIITNAIKLSSVHYSTFLLALQFNFCT